MQIIETLLSQLTCIDNLLDGVYQAIADVDPNYAEEIATYHQGVQALTAEVPEAERYLQARRQKFASDVRFAMWQGFMWNLECFRNPVNKVLANMEFEELCQEARMYTLPAAQAAQIVMDTFLQTLPKDHPSLLEPVTDHFAYLETYGYKLAFCAGFTLADQLLPLVVPGYIHDNKILRWAIPSEDS